MKLFQFMLLSVILTLSLTACETTTEEATVASTEDATVEATEDTTVEATEEATVEATEEATVEAIEEATVEATEEATVEAIEEATVEAIEEATVEAIEEATVEATEDTPSTNAIVKSSLLEAIEKEQYGFPEEVTNKDIETVLNVDGTLEIWVHNSFIINHNAKDTVQFHDIAMYTFIYSSQKIFGTEAYQNVSNIRLILWNGVTDNKQEDFRVAIDRESFDNINWERVLEQITSKYDTYLFTEWYWNVIEM
ncbi:hypothetical protein [Paenibacillus xylanilyticus]|uniref:Uncharacterized protein n=1 Tax=Paenibacillus xylanilyticus TaxID=248903 RepID=A0A7Y6EVE1_9BACL|nr:hypothetical protein [Paenibacillus xylanilyticus]NUU75325.1 hypothetical protein [Paenibacillus xylanilyticus]